MLLRSGAAGAPSNVRAHLPETDWSTPVIGERIRLVLSARWISGLRTVRMMLGGLVGVRTMLAPLAIGRSSSIYPASRLARLNAIQALRDE